MRSRLTCFSNSPKSFDPITLALQEATAKGHDITRVSSFADSRLDRDCEIQQERSKSRDKEQKTHFSLAFSTFPLLSAMIFMRSDISRRSRSSWSFLSCVRPEGCKERVLSQSL